MMWMSPGSPRGDERERLALISRQAGRVLPPEPHGEKAADRPPSSPPPLAPPPPPPAAALPATPRGPRLPSPPLVSAACCSARRSHPRRPRSRVCISLSPSPFPGEAPWPPADRRPGNTPSQPLPLSPRGPDGAPASYPSASGSCARAAPGARIGGLHFPGDACVCLRVASRAVGALPGG